MAIIFDVAVFAIVILLLILDYKRGFIRSVINLVGYAVSAVLAFFISQPVASFIFSSFFRKGSVDMINGELAKLSGGQSVASLLDSAFAAIPERITALASSYVGPLDEIKASIAASAPTTADVATAVVDQVIGPIVTIMIQSLVFLILFIVFCVLVKIITKALKIIDKLPVIGTANAVLGLVVGLVQAVIFLFIFTSVVSLIIQMSGNQMDAINSEVVGSSRIFKAIYNMNPFVGSPIA